MNLYIVTFLHNSDNRSLLMGCLSRGSGQTGIVFGLGTPLDHPPETTQWVTAWVAKSTILYINRSDLLWGARVRWSSGGHETKNNTDCPRSSRHTATYLFLFISGIYNVKIR